MFVELDPGSRDQPLMEENGRIAVSNTAPDVDPDEVLSMLDTDTRDYLQLLVNGAGKGLKNNGYDLREVLRRFEPLHRDLARVNTSIAGRRSELKDLIHNYGSLMSELGKNDEDLKRLVTASEAVFSTFAENDDDVSATFRSLPPALQETAETLPKVERFGKLLGPTLESLRPAFRKVDETNREVRGLARDATPDIRDRIRPFVRTARPIVRDLRPAAIDLARAQPELAKSFNELNRFFNIGAYNPRGAEDISERCENGQGCTDGERRRDEGYLFWLAWTAQNSVSLFETSDAQGPLRRATLNLSCESLRALIRERGQQAPQSLAVLGIPPDALVNDQVCGRAAEPSSE
jgi:phospholipid/cholesterol/gamma-HCH transport system substrate-binding protein